MPEGPRKLLDASALLAYLQRELGFEAVREALREGAAISAVNLAEVAGKLKARGKDPERIVRRLLAMGLEVLPFTLEEGARPGRPHRGPDLGRGGSGRPGGSDPSLRGFPLRQDGPS